VASSPRAPSALASAPASAWPALHAIVDVEVCAGAGWQADAYAAALLDGGATFLQIRAKHLPSRDFLILCDTVVAAAQSYHATVIVNDRVDLAALSGAHGVHVGQDDLSVEDARRLLGGDAVIGTSTHTPEQIAVAGASQPTYLAVGPVFGTVTKDTGYAPVGTELVRRACAATDRPLVAIGGITLGNAGAVLEAGATMVAVIADLLVGNNPTARVRLYLDRFAGV
jgi:thiamine-phosphate pyrophosphorylase